MTAAGKLSVVIETFTPRVANTLRGFCTIVVPELHLHDIAVHTKGDSRWASLPAKPQVGRDGTVRKDNRGKPLYSPVLEFTDRETRDAFSHRVIEALEKFAPQAFDSVNQNAA
jgi:hypothetical protein